MSTLHRKKLFLVAKKVILLLTLMLNLACAHYPRGERPPMKTVVWGRFQLQVPESFEQFTGVRGSTFRLKQVFVVEMERDQADQFWNERQAAIAKLVEQKRRINHSLYSRLLEPPKAGPNIRILVACLEGIDEQAWASQGITRYIPRIKVEAMLLLKHHALWIEGISEPTLEAALDRLDRFLAMRTDRDTPREQLSNPLYMESSVVDIEPGIREKYDLSFSDRARSDLGWFMDVRIVGAPDRHRLGLSLALSHFVLPMIGEKPPWTIRNRPRKIAGMWGHETVYLEPSTKDKAGDLILEWAHDGKADSSEKPNILITLQTSRAHKTSRVLWIWDRVLKSLKPIPQASTIAKP